jgi:hypothetical protein
MECTGSSRPRHGQASLPLAAALRSVAFASVVDAGRRRQPTTRH